MTNPAQQALDQVNKVKAEIVEIEVGVDPQPTADDDAEAGDIVQLKSGGPLMTVVEPSRTITIDCIYWDIHRQEFTKKTIEKDACWILFKHNHDPKEVSETRHSFEARYVAKPS